MLGIILAMHIVLAIIIIGLVLIQHGKGADMGASFGSGASQTVFGSKGSAPFLLKLTAFLGALFFVSSLSLSYLSKNTNEMTLPTPPISIPTQIQTHTSTTNKSPDKPILNKEKTETNHPIKNTTVEAKSNISKKDVVATEKQK